ncbi:hypothetical protein MXAN_4886 [Myxococcus xanthus DK 1622]|uniref:Uncharacterized protein n=1 Tax=Myxococcus xanthus (strain DK1622) TaxID=246197 RepID=Q1D2T0_MYXXD|nr:MULTISPECIES: hypothetical protein [Myxococcus]ABF91661.1 hypothetical protein MXAN_4886 [Myxococcus xanthus DK 1622]NOJ56345.1 hypothetical protein [Myxococcus xanthus]QPM77416.1 hypothetical protein I5Q59_24160 [Myxococcus xanthus]QVW66483.1 hypothetical protein JTM82_29515 [Myxococcus xanthus DZ2]QZZ52554.1 hypothetical protein MyxoNM_25420 [Myxococcus xanthus]
MSRLPGLTRALARVLALTASAADADTLRRFALVAGDDQGGADTRPLRFARDDAGKMHALLLRLGDTRLGFDDLKRWLAEPSSSIRIAILDSCRAGAMTRTKGARRAPDGRGMAVLDVLAG